jgi:protein arginine kinase activator
MMSKVDKCQICSAKATVHLTQVANGTVTKIHLCEACAQKKGVTDPQGFALTDLLSKTLSMLAQGQGEEDNERFTCPVCGHTASMLKKQGRMGCSACYTAMAPIIAPVIRNLHKDKKHSGKIPEAFKTAHHLQQLEALQKQLSCAIQQEHYEEAARLRDAIEQFTLKHPKPQA